MRPANSMSMRSRHADRHLRYGEHVVNAVGIKFLTISELKDWCAERDVELDNLNMPVHPHRGSIVLRCDVPKEITRLTWFSQFIERSLQMNKDCLLWVTSWGIWASSENWHLYYRLRRSYGDERLIEEAPGHLFGASNVPDLVTFVEIGLIAGWDMYLIPTIGQGRVFVSHDEWIEIAMDDPTTAERIKIECSKSGLNIRSSQ